MKEHDHTPGKNNTSDTAYNNSAASNRQTGSNKEESNQLQIPQISLPKGGGAIKSIDEKFSVNAANGTAGFSIPFPFSPSRNAFMPAMALSYNSGSGNGTFGLGWNAEPPSISRKTEKKLPAYDDANESDTFVFSGAEDLVPSYTKDESDNWIKDVSQDGLVTRYKPRIEGSFARIEKITEENGNVYWKVTSKDNILSVFGKSKSAKIFNAADPTKIFKWLLEFSCDDKGNCFQLEYKKEDKINVPNELHERNRLNDFSMFTNTYLKKVKYCNTIHFNREDLDFSDWENFLPSIEYLLELVLDYGEHNANNPQPGDDNGWTCRRDPFSDYRAGFEIRNYRLCQRVLMFHNFSELGSAPCLVRSMAFVYEQGTAFTFLKSIIQKGFIRITSETYSDRSLPPIEFTYEPLGWNTDIQSLPKESLENLPVGIDDQAYQWIDLYSEGISGVLTEQANGWYYKSNLGDGNFDAVKLVSPKPSLSGLSVGAVHFQDIEANGQKSLVSNDLKGYFEFTPDKEWNPFKPFNELPNIDTRDPNLKFLDLDGDGRSDMLISEDNVFVWYASKGKAGFDDYRLARKSNEEEKGPNIVFADSTQSIVLADMSGDGLMDIVRIRNIEIVYWPNLGYGKFGAKVSMSNAPLFDHPDHFNPNYIKLADLDGSGITDIVYLAKDSFKIYFNQSGNSWSEENIVHGVNPLPFLKMDDHANVSIVDLIGTGTGCIVWSSPLPKHAGNPLRYIDLMGGKKPHIMTGYKNNMGKEVNMVCKPSTHYYLEDKKAGNPWITKLPFPVQCVSQVEMIDQVRKSRFTNQYSYHHGYYDYNEREFRGFGRVDQTDTEDYENYKKHANPNGSIQIVDEGFHEPPVLTKTWFHTGAFIDKEKILTLFAHEYYQNVAVPENILNEPSLPGDLSIDEWREALRACKGMPLHVEVYSIDGSEKQNNPYTTAQHTCLIQKVQPKLDNKHAVFMVLESEALTYTYERNPGDPRIAHSMNIEVDELGNVLKAAAISYGRKTVDDGLTESEQLEQSKTHIIFTENDFTNKIDDSFDYRLPLLYEAKTFELTGLSPASGKYFTISEIKNDFQNAGSIAYQIAPTAGRKEKRLIEHVQSLFLKNDLSGPLASGQIESLCLPYQSYKLALTPDLRDYIFGERVSNDLLVSEGKYFQLDDVNYWIASGTQTIDANNFYQVIEITDPFGYKVQIGYDENYHFFIKQITDELENKSEVLRFNFRTLAPYLMKDVNDNRSGVRLDELGMVMSTFVMGKETENKGDLLDTNFIEVSDTDRPSGKLEYELLNYIDGGKPNFVKTLVRETHHFDNIEPVIWQTAYSYSDGSGNEVMRKVQAEPGIALQENEDGTVTEVDTTPHLRWVGNGRTILNNKGKPVKQYEPYFSITPEYEDAKELVERGVTPIITYDSAGRVIKTVFPDFTFMKVEFDPWMQKSFDQNDTVKDSKWYLDRINNWLDEEFIEDGKDPAKEKEAAQKAAAHDNTPAVSYLDSLGRNFLSIADNATNVKYKTLVETDIEGNVHKITDARGNTVMQYKYDMLGNQLYSLSMDAGERWGLTDVMGKPMQAWDSRNHHFRYEYDRLHRPIKSFLTTGDAPEINFGRILYGEGIENDKQLNLRSKPFQHFDESGIVTNTICDFKGNLLQSSRQLCSDYKNEINWNANPATEEAIFISSTAYDALNRAVIVTTPDNSTITPSYNEANLLEKVEVQLKGAAEKTIFVKDIDYNEKAQRESFIYGNDTKTNYRYDKKTFRLTHLLTTGKNGTDLLQKLSYTYDPVGNITFIKDEAQQTIFFNNTIVEPSSNYVYDAIYQLIEAKGREHIGQNQLPDDNWKDINFTKLIHKGDGNAMRSYTQTYSYDEVGNILKLIHSANGGSYTRTYGYNNDADRITYEINPNSIKNNQLLATTIGNTTFRYHHDEHGNIDQMPHLALMEWDFKDQLHSTQQTIINNGNGERTYYVYDAGGQRIRKITERQGTTNKKEERIYFGAFEIYRSYKTDGSTIELERETLHIMDDKSKIALVETKTVDNGSNDTTALHVSLTRYQYSNHLGSACLELNEDAAIISYEEYHPYGTTSYQATDKNINPVAKRYRYTGLERDEESGFEYHSTRYYLPWLGRWLSADAIGVKGGINLFCYCFNNSVRFNDISGNGPKRSTPLGNVDPFPNVEILGPFCGPTGCYDDTELSQIQLKKSSDEKEAREPYIQAITIRYEIEDALQADVDREFLPSRERRRALERLDTFKETGVVTEPYVNMEGGPAPVNITALYLSKAAICAEFWELCIASRVLPLLTSQGDDSEGMGAVVGLEASFINPGIGVEEGASKALTTDIGAAVDTGTASNVANAARLRSQLTLEETLSSGKFIMQDSLEVGSTRVAVFDLQEGEMLIGGQGAGTHIGVVEGANLPFDEGRFVGGFIKITNEGTITFTAMSGTFPYTAADLPSNVLDYIRGLKITVNQY
jgi:RHS repeat-associated protein